MKIWLCVVSMLLCVQAAWAQVTAEYPDVPMSDQAYTDLTTLYDSSAWLEYSHNFENKIRPMTRYEFAIAVARYMGANFTNGTLQQNEDNNQARILGTKQNSQKATALARLLKQFAPELHMLGFTPSYLESMHLLLTGEAGVTKDSPVVPSDSPAYTDLTLIYNSALIECCYGCNGKFVPLTRYDFAVTIARLVQNVSVIRASQTRFTAEDSRVNAALARLLVQFTPELRELGLSAFDLDTAYKTLTDERRTTKASAVAPSFNDIPPGHWAYNAVEHLRLSGIIMGDAPR
jgi:hypothetical protein